MYITIYSPNKSEATVIAKKNFFAYKLDEFAEKNTINNLEKRVRKCSF